MKGRGVCRVVIALSEVNRVINSNLATGLFRDKI